MVEKCAKECGEYSHCHEHIRGWFVNSDHVFGYLIRQPDAIIMLNCLSWFRKPHKVIRDAVKLGIVTVGVVDTDVATTEITYPIPGNDESVQSIQFYLKYMKHAILAGKKKRLQDIGDDSAQESMATVYKELKRLVKLENADSELGESFRTN